MLYRNHAHVHPHIWTHLEDISKVGHSSTNRHGNDPASKPAGTKPNTKPARECDKDPHNILPFYCTVYTLVSPWEFPLISGRFPQRMPAATVILTRLKWVELLQNFSRTMSPVGFPLSEVKVRSPALSTFQNSHLYNYRRISVLLYSKCK